jgi:hypothetical protein
LIERISRRFVEQNESCLIEVWLALFSALSSRHRYFVVAVIVQISTLGVGCAKRQPGQPVNSLSPAQANSEIRRLNKEIEKLRNSSDAPEGWKELQTAQAKIEELRFRTFELSQSPQVYQWQQRIDKLQQELDEIAAADHRLTVDDGARLFHARHAELSKQVPNTPKLHGLGFDVLNYPRIDGSTSTQPLATFAT